MIRFVIDAQLPPGLALRLEGRGYAAQHVNRIGMGVEADTAIWNYAANAGATLITKDEDFVVLARRESAGPQDRKSFGSGWEISATAPYGGRSTHGSTRSFNL